MTPEEQARRLRDEHAPGEIPVPAESIAKEWGAQVVYHRFDGPESGFALRDGARWMLGINSNTSPRRQRTATAHALGHAVLHNRPIIVCRTIHCYEREMGKAVGSDREEAEANAFTAGLLLPPDEVMAAHRTLMKRPGGKGARDDLVAALARKFDVSDEFLCFRLVALGVLSC